MKYRIKSIYFSKEKHNITKRLKAKRKHTCTPCILPPILSGAETEKIDIGALFEAKALPSAKKKRPSPVSAVFIVIKDLLRAISSRVRAMLSHRQKKNLHLAFFGGVITASGVASVICALAVLGKLFFPYMRSYTSVTVPTLIGERIEDAEFIDGDSFELLVSYENSSEISAGVIISQRPASGVIRKIYDEDKPCIISVTVSAGKSFYQVEKLSGTDGRLTLLSLYNKGISALPEYVYSDTVKTGTVVESVPPQGSLLYDGETLIIKISKGKKVVSVSVPDLYGLSEAQASALLTSKGLVLGNVTYSPSVLAVGKIISQQYSPFSSVPKGSTVDITVSIGRMPEQKTVPDLYGLTVEQAASKLSDVGLVLGDIAKVQSGAPSGTIITQSISAGTPITSSVTSVDVGVSQ